jgi:hypothetical protein
MLRDAAKRTMPDDWHSARPLAVFGNSRTEWSSANCPGGRGVVELRE